MFKIQRIKTVKGVEYVMYEVEETFDMKMKAAFKIKELGGSRNSNLTWKIVEVKGEN